MHPSTKTTTTSPSLTELLSGTAVDVERQVALLDLDVVVIEDHPVRAQLLGDGPVHALVVLVALVAVGEVAVGLGTLVRQVVGLLWGGGGARGRGRGRPRASRLAVASGPLGYGGV